MNRLERNPCGSPARFRQRLLAEVLNPPESAPGFSSATIDSNPASAPIEPVHFEREPTLRKLLQRSRMILDVAIADLEVAQSILGPFHPTTGHFRMALHEARWSWNRLCGRLSEHDLRQALAGPPATTLTLQAIIGAQMRRVVLVPIGGQTYRAQRVRGTSLAPVQWRLTRLNPPLENGPYFACRLQDGSTQCDCADWTYNFANPSRPGRTACKHLAALGALGWI
jgi:hypothetical protein